MRAWGVAALAALLGACSGGIVPPASGGSQQRWHDERPSPAAPSATRGRIMPEPSRERELPVRQPTAATPIAPARAAPAGDAATGIAAGALAGPAIKDLPIDEDGAAAALAAYRSSCRALETRPDQSGLTRGSDWTPSCTAAQSWRASDARAFFIRHFEAVQIADGAAFATGYYEPEIAGSRTRRAGYDVPIYAKPDDLIDVDLGLFNDAYKGKHIRGRVEGQDFVPYYDRAAIEDGALAGRGLEIGYAADAVEFFFLQVQGSGRVRLPDGGVLRIGYAGQNGRDYTAIGKLMKDRGLLAPGQANMQGIMAWLRANPAQGRAIMRENKSWVFFQELTGPGPLGALGYPVTGQVSAAADPKFVPLGAPVFLSMDRSDATGLWVTQDTGGAIKGANRFDTFWGAGPEARATAGGMSAHGTAFLLLPVGTLARLSGA